FANQIARLRFAIAGETLDGAPSFVDAMTRKNDHVQVTNVVNLGPQDECIDRRNDLVRELDLVAELCEELQLSSRRIPGEEPIFGDRFSVGFDHPARALLEWKQKVRSADFAPHAVLVVAGHSSECGLDRLSYDGVKRFKLSLQSRPIGLRLVDVLDRVLPHILFRQFQRYRALL